MLLPKSLKDQLGADELEVGEDFERGSCISCIIVAYRFKSEDDNISNNKLENILLTRAQQKIVKARPTARLYLVIPYIAISVIPLGGSVETVDDDKIDNSIKKIAITMTTTSAEPSSWAEYVRSVDKDRKKLPWDPNSVEPVKRVSLYHVSSF